jgi:hypothetical protein
MNREAINRLRGVYEEAFWRWREDIGIGDSYQIEKSNLDARLLSFQHALENGYESGIIEARDFLEQNGELSQEVKDLLALFLPGVIPVLYSDPDFETSCRLVVSDFSGINTELVAYVANHPHALRDLGHRDFEKLLEAIFRNHGYQTRIGPGSGDGGVDLMLIQKDIIGEMVTLVQAKRYAPHRPIELEAVAALYGIVESEKANRGLFVTTSRFLPSAKRFAEQSGRKIMLATSEDVARWCRDVIPQKTWI